MPILVIFFGIYLILSHFPAVSTLNFQQDGWSDDPKNRLTTSSHGYLGHIMRPTFSILHFFDPSTFGVGHRICLLRFFRRWLPTGLETNHRISMIFLHQNSLQLFSKSKEDYLAQIWANKVQIYHNSIFQVNYSSLNHQISLIQISLILI